MCQNLETTEKATDDQEKRNNFFNKIKSWNHVGAQCTSGALSMFREIRFYNSVEQPGIAHHFCPLCSSSTFTSE